MKPKTLHLFLGAATASLWWALATQQVGMSFGPPVVILALLASAGCIWFVFKDSE